MGIGSPSGLSVTTSRRLVVPADCVYRTGVSDIGVVVTLSSSSSSGDR